MSSLKTTVALSMAGAVLALPLSLAVSSPSFAKHHKARHAAKAKMHTPPPSEMKSTPDSKQTPTGGQPGGPAGKS